MQIKAENEPRYSRKFLYMGIGALVFSLWCLKDAAFKYPAEREQAFAEFKEYDKTFFSGSHKSLGREEFGVVADAKKRDEFDTYTHERGLHGTAEIFTQYLMAIAMVVAGLILVSIPLRARGRWIENTDDGINSSWGESFRFDEVEEVNKRKWRNKGIAKVTYVSNGRRRTFDIDDYKFDRYRTDAILYELEQRIDLGRITNGPPEPAPEGPVAEVLGIATPAEPAPAT
jgi:hypothetical protein